MKKLLLIFLMLPLMAFNILQSEKDFIGRWTGEDKNKIGFLTFDAEGYASFEINGQVMGGKEFTYKGEKGKMVYSINMDAEPIEVDLTMTKFESGEEKTMLCIAKFENKDTMRFAMGMNNIRPVDFETGQTIVLTRVK